MIAIIIKDLRIFTNTRKYLIIQFVVLSLLVLGLFLGTIEFYAQGTDTNQNGKPLDVGKQIYTLFILCIFFALFLVPRHAVDTLNLEFSGGYVNNSPLKNRSNWSLLHITPLRYWRIIMGKLIAIVVWSVWLIWISGPLFALSSYLGGVPIEQYVLSGIVIVVSCLFFAMIGMGFALWLTPINAKGVSYAVVLIITFLPLLPISPFVDLPMLTKLSPIASLLSGLQSGVNELWMWNIGLYCLICVLIFPLLVWRLSKM